MASVKVTNVSYDEYTDMDFKPPATFFVKDAMGTYVFVHTRSRAAAQTKIDELYGEGRYKVSKSR